MANPFDLRERYEDVDGRIWQREGQNERYGTGWWKVRLARRKKRRLPIFIGRHPNAHPLPHYKYRIWSTRRQLGGNASAEWIDLRVNHLDGWVAADGRRRQSGRVNVTFIDGSAVGGPIGLDDDHVIPDPVPV